jgi:hypothetical protein
MADMGATDHMLPDRLALILYKLVWHLCVCMGNNSYPPVLGRGTAIISLNGQRLLISNVLHVPALRVPLYSLRAHIRQGGYGFLGIFETGMHVYFPFPGVVLSVDMSTNCHLSYKSFGKSSPLSSLHYVQPWCPPVLYPAKSSAFHAHTGADPSPELCLSGDPVLIKNDSSNAHGACDVNNGSPPSTDDMAMDLPTIISPVPKQVCRAKSNTFLADDSALISRHLKFLDPVAPKLLSSLMRWFDWCIVPVPFFHPLVHVIGATASTLKLTELRRNFIVLLAAVVSATTNISYRPALMDNGLMERSSCYCWVHLRRSRKLLAVAPLTTNNHSSLTLSTSILPLVTAFWWEASGTPSFSPTKPLVTTGCLASRTFPVSQFLWLSISSGQMLVLMLGVSGVIVTPNFWDEDLRTSH